ncbi:hypothetical protein ACH5RR_015748 [Cinchona calisaya]|uniref:Uncharacterized protein n=1 Tax=Cinchona calisaya TaxID=153742 RepID=A0ABD2ZU27_9GENT
MAESEERDKIGDSGRKTSMVGHASNHGVDGVGRRCENVYGERVIGRKSREVVPIQNLKTLVEGRDHQGFDSFLKTKEGERGVKEGDGLNWVGDEIMIGKLGISGPNSEGVNRPKVINNPIDGTDRKMRLG